MANKIPKDVLVEFKALDKVRTKRTYTREPNYNHPYIALCHGRLDKLEYALKNFPRYIDQKHHLIYHAVCSNKLSVVKHAVQRFNIGSEILNSYLTSSSLSMRDVMDVDDAFTMACYNGNMSIIKYLVSLGATIYKKRAADFISAYENKKWNVIEYLIKNGADIHAENGKFLKKIHNDVEAIYEILKIKFTALLVNNFYISHICSIGDTDQIDLLLKNKFTAGRILDGAYANDKEFVARYLKLKALSTNKPTTKKALINE